MNGLVTSGEKSIVDINIGRMLQVKITKYRNGANWLGSSNKENAAN